MKEYFVKMVENQILFATNEDDLEAARIITQDVIWMRLGLDKTAQRLRMAIASKVLTIPKIKSRA